MIKYILVPATGGDSDEPVFAAALAVARPWGAHLAFLHVRVDTRQVLIAMASADMGGGGGYTDLMTTVEQQAASQQDKAERAVRAFCAREQIAITANPGAAAVTAEWRIEVGEEPEWLAHHGRVADLLVIGRSREQEPVAMPVLEAALMATGRPVLLAPGKPLTRVDGTVAIAWKDAREAARAVDAAAPFIDAADRIVILSVQEARDVDDRSCERLCDAMRWRHSHVEVRRFQTNDRLAADVMLDAAAEVGASLLVMGGYSHSRVREMVLGGFTRRILQGAELPVLMAH